MKVEISAATLASLCGGKFTVEACECIEDFIEECGSSDAFTIGDICISFDECDKNDIDEDDEEYIIGELSNGNVVISR